MLTSDPIDTAPLTRGTACLAGREHPHFQKTYAIVKDQTPWPSVTRLTMAPSVRWGSPHRCGVADLALPASLRKPASRFFSPVDARGFNRPPTSMARRRAADQFRPATRRPGRKTPLHEQAAQIGLPEVGRKREFAAMVPPEIPEPRSCGMGEAGRWTRRMAARDGRPGRSAVNSSARRQPRTRGPQPLGHCLAAGRPPADTPSAPCPRDPGGGPA
jgi:hypothetical protein